jgi:hypothetical protein
MPDISLEATSREWPSRHRSNLPSEGMTEMTTGVLSVSFQVSRVPLEVNMTMSGHQVEGR